MKRHMLATDEVEAIIQYHFEKKEREIKSNILVNDEWVKCSIPSENDFIPAVSYFYNKNKHAVVIATPLAVVQITDGGGEQPVYDDVISKIRNQIQDTDSSITGVLIGKGTSERHYVAFHEHDHKMAIFDSKISNMDRFLSSANSPTFLEKMWGYFVLPMKTIANALGFIKETKASFNKNEVAVYRLGTQAMMDGISCGYHSAGNVLSILDGITKNDSSNADDTSSHFNAPKKVGIKNCMLYMARKGLDKHVENLLDEKNTSSKPLQPVSAGLSTLSVSAAVSPQKNSTTQGSALKIAPVENTTEKTGVSFDQEPQESSRRNGYF